MLGGFTRKTHMEIQDARDTICRDTARHHWDFRVLIEHLDRLASMFARTSSDQHRSLIAEFHSCAGQLPYAQEYDYGALVLEAAGDAVAVPELRRWLHTEARIRAEMCARGGTAGGECIARYQHVRRLDEKLRSA